MSRTLACVVAYNRSAMLSEVLDALLQQLPPEDVLVVDNASTDDTAEVVRSRSGVRYFNPGSNIGGAGGFAWAIELAIALEYDYAYLLDDDAIPNADAIAVLEHSAPELLNRAGLGFLVSEPVTHDPGREPVGIPVPAKSWGTHKAANALGGIAVDYASFLGILIPLALARRTPLPYPEFFIWCDDVEYTRRIALDRGGACLLTSTIRHESPEMEAADRARSLGWKYFYLVRNRLWLARWGLPKRDRGHRVASVLIAIWATRSELVAGRFRPRVLRAAAVAWSKGLLTKRPRPHEVGSLLAGSPAAARWVEAEVAVEAVPR